VFFEQGLEPDSLRGRVSREMKFPAGCEVLDVAACQAACPLGQDVPGYIRALACGDFQSAASIIYQTNPLPSVCGRLCLGACMNACTQKHLDTPVAIKALKRVAIERACASALPVPKADVGRKVVVIGAGPAGLSAAYFLRRAGYGIEMIDDRSEAGGLLRWAVPGFDLPRKVLAAEIDVLRKWGVEFVFNRRIEAVSELQAFLDQGASAVVLATGAGCGQALGLEGEDLVGCTDALAFSSRFAQGDAPAMVGPVVVAGAGNMAVAVARLAKRAGAGTVCQVMSRARNLAPAGPLALRLAEEEGIEIMDEYRPVRLLGKGQVRAVQVAPEVFGPADAVGRRWSNPHEPVAEALEIKAGMFIAARDRCPELAWLGDGYLNLLGCLQVDPDSYRTSIPGVFGCGEAISGARNSIESIALGRRVARSILGSMSVRIKT
jgi:NADPH-dependent glutamate synthase beta subunit-like oxidoreductase